MGAAVSDARARVFKRDRGEALGPWVGFFASEGRNEQVKDVLHDPHLGGLGAQLCLRRVVVLGFGERASGF